MDKYTVEAGRSILRNGRRFVSLTRAEVHATAYGPPSPSDCDTFARAVAAMPEALQLCIWLLDRSDVRHFISVELGDQARLHEALNKGRAALALLPKQED